MSEERFEWDRKTTLNLIKHYKSHALLWDPSYPYYKNKEKRQQALVDIGTYLNADRGEVERKIKNITSHFLREKKKEKQSETNGHDLFRSKWFAYKHLDFLNNRPICKKKKRVQPSCSGFALVADDGRGEETHHNSDESTDHVNSSLGRILSQQNQIKTVDPFPDTISTFCETSASSSRDDSSAFGEYIANKIRAMDKRTKSIVEYEINSIIFRAEMGSFNSNKYDLVDHTV